MLGLNIRSIRMSKGLSLRKLALLADVSNSTLSDIENSKTNASVGTLKKLADAMKCNQSDFFDDKEVSSVIAATNEEDKDLDLFVTKTVAMLLEEGFIDDPNNISDSVIQMVIDAVKLDAERKKNR